MARSARRQCVIGVSGRVCGGPLHAAARNGNTGTTRPPPPGDHVMRAVFVVAISLAWASHVPAAGPLAGKKPNVVFILTDDQGYGDVSAHGNPVLKTPNLDRLHGESARFTDFHVSPTCAPTRSALLTGRHEFRNGVTHTIHERERLAPDSITYAQVLQRA